MLLDNRANGRVADVLAKAMRNDRLSLLTNAFSVYAYNAMRQSLGRVSEVRLLVPETGSPAATAREPFRVNGLTGSAADQSLRNKLDLSRLARDCAEWLEQHAEVRAVTSKIPQNLFHVANENGNAVAIHGSSTFTTSGMGITPSEGFDIFRHERLLRRSARSLEPSGLVRQHLE
jgi:hypothetical protein